MKLSIIVPTFNEEGTIEPLLRRIAAVPFPLETEIVVVDDHSEDRTFEIERRLRKTAAGAAIPIRLLHNPSRQGKGACLQRGVENAAGDFVIVQDADLEYDPAQIPKLIRPLLENRADAVYGSRFLENRRPEGMDWPHRLANRLMTALADRLYGLRLTDAYTCYKALRRELLEKLGVRSNGFEWEAEVTAKLGRRRVPILEIPISYRARTRRAGKKIRPLDLLTGVQTLLRWRFSREARPSSPGSYSA